MMFSAQRHALCIILFKNLRVEYLVKKSLFSFQRIQIAEVKKKVEHAKEVLNTLYGSPRRALAHWYVRGEMVKTTC